MAICCAFSARLSEISVPLLVSSSCAVSAILPALVLPPWFRVLAFTSSVPFAHCAPLSVALSAAIAILPPLCNWAVLVSVPASTSSDLSALSCPCSEASRFAESWRSPLLLSVESAVVVREPASIRSASSATSMPLLRTCSPRISRFLPCSVPLFSSTSPAMPSVSPCIIPWLFNRPPLAFRTPFAATLPRFSSCPAFSTSPVSASSLPSFCSTSLVALSDSP